MTGDNFDFWLELVLNAELARREMIENARLGIWKTAEDEELHISELSLNHLINILARYYEPGFDSIYMVYYHDQIEKEICKRLEVEHL